MERRASATPAQRSHMMGARRGMMQERGGQRARCHPMEPESTLPPERRAEIRDEVGKLSPAERHEYMKAIREMLGDVKEHHRRGGRYGGRPGGWRGGCPKKMTGEECDMPADMPVDMPGAMPGEGSSM